MAELSDGIQQIRGVGPAKAKALEKLGIRTVEDLICCFPRRYEDRREIASIGALSPGQTACIRARVLEPPVYTFVRRGLELIRLRAADDTGAVDVTFFNQPWLKNSLRAGQLYLFYGKVEGGLLRRTMSSPLVETPGQCQRIGRIVPVYPLTAGISQLFLSRLIHQALKACSGILPDCLPDSVRQAHGLCRVSFAYENIHLPKDDRALDIARRRLAFEELFFFSIGLKLLRHRRETVHTAPLQPVDMAPFYAALPFSLTPAQLRCIREAEADLCRSQPMNRLCQGDVGSGKTVVAAACVYFCVKNGRQAAMMAPTELLAQQHFRTLSPLLGSLGVRCALLTGSTPARERRQTAAALSDGTADFVMGTHALFSGDLSYADLGLVITDEQHRFGVAQRAALSEKGIRPHTLVMSATPIPRTLALILYGDLDVSVIDQLPPGRKAVKTYAVSSDYHPRLYGFIRRQVAEGRQVYIICPQVGSEEAAEEDAPQDDHKAVTDYARRLQTEVFPDLRVAFVHGKMSPKEKDGVMCSFAQGEADILVSTTVVEVGVDVANASLIVVENAECFGLSQLHQLRGRVGRGEHQSYCVLVSDLANEDTRQRLRAMTKTADGFQIAQEDLRLRGPGDFFGQRQHGLPGLRVANLGCDTLLLTQAQAAAAALLEQDPQLTAHPDTARQIHRLFQDQTLLLN